MSATVTKSPVVASRFLDHLHSPRRPVLVFDGATGTSLQQLDLTAEDFGGAELEGCNENLVITRPDAVQTVHRQFLEVGCDVIETDTFGAASIVLAEYGLEDKAFELNKRAKPFGPRTESSPHSSPGLRTEGVSVTSATQFLSSFRPSPKRREKSRQRRRLEVQPRRPRGGTRPRPRRAPVIGRWGTRRRRPKRSNARLVR